MRISLPLQSIVIGLTASVALTGLIALFAPPSITSLWSQPGVAVGLALARLTPTSWIYAFEPEGGAAAFGVFVGLGTLIAWWTILAVGYYTWRRLALRRRSGMAA
jgi:hypothetical protein